MMINRQIYFEEKNILFYFYDSEFFKYKFIILCHVNIFY